jgi:hypothetical protein
MRSCEAADALEPITDNAHEYEPDEHAALNRRLKSWNDSAPVLCARSQRSPVAFHDLAASSASSIGFAYGKASQSSRYTSMFPHRKAALTSAAPTFAPFASKNRTQTKDPH